MIARLWDALRGRTEPAPAAPRAGGLDTVHAINQRIFETSLDLILVVDRRGTFTRVSPSALAIIGYPPGDMVGRSATEFVFQDDLENTRQEMRLARRGLEMRNFDCRYRHKDGRVVPLSWTGVWSEPEQQHFFIGRDMTERIAAEERQRHSQRLEAIGQLTGGIAHDFNNMLTVIIGNADQAQREAHNPAAVQEACEMILEAGAHSADLIRRMLAFARQQPLQPKRTDVRRLVTEVSQLIRRTLGEDIDVNITIANDVRDVTIDPSQLESSLLNLAINARDAMPTGGRLFIEASNAELDQAYAEMQDDVVPGEYVMLAISDTGTGMTQETMRRAFDPFFTTKAPGKGTGLGLSMVFGFVKQSGGHIKLYSELGLGTTIKIFLPCAKGLPGTEALSVDPRVDINPVGNETILLVEDDPLVRKHVTADVRRLGYNVLVAGNGAEAIAILGEPEPSIDLLFTDVVMPGGMSGRDVAERARQLRPGIKVLYMSGYTQDSIVHHGRLDPGVHLLSKPFRIRDLAVKLRQMLDR